MASETFWEFIERHGVSWHAYDDEAKGSDGKMPPNVAAYFDLVKTRPLPQVIVMDSADGRVLGTFAVPGTVAELQSKIEGYIEK